jgi:general secretion pathway protein C
MGNKYKLLLGKILSISRFVLVIVLAFALIRTVFIFRDSGETLTPSSAAAASNFSQIQHDSQSRPALSDYTAIFEKNIFGGSSVSSANLISSAGEMLDLSLIGTVSGSLSAARAIIKNTSTNSSGLYKIGDTVNGATIETIENSSVILNKASQRYVLNLYSKGQNPESINKTVQNFSNSQINDAGETTASAKLNDIETVIKTANIEPKEVEGKVEGLKISELGNAKKIASALGLKNGDIIQSVNDQTLTSSQKAFQVLKKARTESKISVKLLRDGKTETLSFPLR